MPNVSYLKGYAAEREVIKLFENRYSCVSIRSAGSHGSIDVIAGNGREVYAIQVKVRELNRSFNAKQLLEDAKEFKAIPVYAHKQPYKGWSLDQILPDGTLAPLRHE